MEVTLLLSPELAAVLTEARATPARAALETALGPWRANIRAVAPGVQDDRLSRYFVVDVPAHQAAELRERLSGLAEVEAAYIKPEDAPP
jgi:hypothetical protein